MLTEPQLVVREGRQLRRGGPGVPARPPRAGRPDPASFKATYIPLEGNFTSNLRGGDAFVQVGLGLSTFYDEHVDEKPRRPTKWRSVRPS